MSDIPTIVASLDARLNELASEITSLQDARAALETRALAATRAATADGAAPVTRTRRATASPRKRVAASRSPATDPKSELAVTPAAAPKSPRSRAPRQAAGSPTSSRRGSSSLSREQLERLLGDARSGLSAAAIAKQAGVAGGRVLALLRELEASGTVRRTGQRRSTLWLLITDEDRIAERAAELERQFAARRVDRTHRRGRARAS